MGKTSVCTPQTTTSTLPAFRWVEDPDARGVRGISIISVLSLEVGGQAAAAVIADARS